MDWVVSQFGLPRAKYYRWKRRREEGRLEDAVVTPRSALCPLPEEEAAVVAFARAHPREGYRRLAWMMVDADVAYVSPGSVYRVLDRHDLLYRWKRSAPSAGRRPAEATHPDEVWHVDILYLWIAGRWYFLATLLDSYSRYVVDWELALSMRAEEVIDLTHRALEARPNARPRVVRDNGSQFTSREWRQLMSQFSLHDIAIRVAHPESNGRIERYHRSLREEGVADVELRDLYQARDQVGRWVQHYNDERLHAALNYLRPVDYYKADPEHRLAERRRKLEEATTRRQAVNQRGVSEA